LEGKASVTLLMIEDIFSTIIGKKIKKYNKILGGGRKKKKKKKEKQSGNVSLLLARRAISPASL